ncbi:MAG: DEAD/DEAH box helicase [Bifidobacteriaceae bacterium]|nr:DEAD/DEAH box helicase [Bifidobacteriaceae bacterium]
MTSPAEAFAAFKARGGEAPLDRFAAGLGFPLDPYQREACLGLAAGESVLVAAPTGAGKTVVALYGIDQALDVHQMPTTAPDAVSDGPAVSPAGQRRAFYTTPIKALSNQKFRELSERYGSDSVGLLTGDQSIRAEAPIVVMTTEVLRNMLYADSSALAGLALVVLDEVHYLADRFRGPVWEEVLIQLPQSVQVVALSATVSNAEEFGEWMALVRGTVRVVVCEVRPVPLWQHVLTREGLKDLYAPTPEGELSPNLNPELALIGQRSPGRGGTRGRYSHHGSGSAGGRGRRGGVHGPGPSAAGGRVLPRFAVIESLDREGLLPAIYFVFSRAGCEAAAEQCLSAGLVLTTEAEEGRIREVLERRAMALAPADLAVVDFPDFLAGAARGFAPHHAGMLPLFKEAVEELFQAGLLKVVFATETLSLGINMPARTVVIDRLDKWDGAAHSDLTPGEYTQLTGRAGRRGIDVEGHAVVVAGPRVAPAKVLPLASKRTYPLRSAFHPTYNMAVNLIQRLGPERARQVLGLSFAQFQVDRSLVGLTDQLRRLDQAIEGYAQAMRCDRGDFAQYQDLRNQLTWTEKTAAKSRASARRDQTRAVLADLKRGDVLRLAGGRQRGLILVVHPGKSGAGRPLVLTEKAKSRRVVLGESSVTRVGHIKLKGGDAVKTPEERAKMARRLVELASVPAASDTPEAAWVAGTEPGAEPGRAASDQPGPTGTAGTSTDGPPSQAASDRLGPTETAGTEPGARPGQAASDELGPTGMAGTEAAHQTAAPAGPAAGVPELRAALKAHPVHNCPDRETHARWARRWVKARGQRDRLVRATQARTGSLARQFDQVSAVLEDLGYLEDGHVTAAGRMLARIYAERDLVMAQCLRSGAWEGLSPAGLAAALAALVYEPRTDLAPPVEPLNKPVRLAIAAQEEAWARVREQEDRHSLPASPVVAPAASATVWRWASGQSLASTLTSDLLSPGDFVRLVTRLIDVLDHIRAVAPDHALYQSADLAINALRRGVVAADL